MPKMKTNRMAHKKFRVGGTGRVKHALAGTSHNTGKKSSKRIRQLRGRRVVDKTNTSALQGQLPYAGIKD
ncbi:MAG: 50S ribosomal protein L35 [Deltaproteobacteria bacterium]|nr:50S ribosomal protein L35 [Deltaproteobacteria bacterium]